MSAFVCVEMAECPFEGAHSHCVSCGAELCYSEVSPPEDLRCSSCVPMDELDDEDWG